LQQQFGFFPRLFLQQQKRLCSAVALLFFPQAFCISKKAVFKLFLFLFSYSRAWFSLWLLM